VSANAGPCTDTAGASLSTLQPCSSGSLTQSGAASAVELDLGSISGRDVGVFSLASLAAATSTSRAVTGRFTSPAIPYCTTASGTGCVAAAVKGYLGNTVLGNLPPPSVVGDTLPSGFGGLVQLSNWQGAVAADSGVGSGTSTVTTSGSLKYWDAPSGTYKTLTLGAAAAASLTIPALVVHYKLPDGSTLDVSMSASIQYGGYTTPSAASGTCASTACIVEEKLNAPVVGSLTYTLNHGGVTLANFVESVDWAPCWRAPHTRRPGRERH